jgi:tetratricopeptide (TPR) repeat protein
VLRDRGLLDESSALYRDAIAIFRAQPVAWPAPQDLGAAVNQQVATSQIYYARLLIMRSDFEAADALLAESIPALRRIYDGDHPLVGMAFREYGYLRIEQGRYDEADRFLAEAQRIQLELLGPDHSSVPRARAHQAELARRRGQLPAAVTLARRTVGDFERLGIADHPSAVDARVTLAEALLSQGESRIASRELRQALTTAERQFTAGDRRVERIRRSLARARGNRGSATSTAP